MRCMIDRRWKMAIFQEVVRRFRYDGFETAKDEVNLFRLVHQ